MGGKGGAIVEQRMTPVHWHRGSMLVIVLIVTAVGLLFGSGALLLFRYQCQLRIDRQHELEKVYAVRSALNYIRVNVVDAIPSAGRLFGFHTWSERDLKLLVKPVEPIFPKTFTNEDGKVIRHFDMGTSNTNKYNHFETPCTSPFCHCLNHFNVDYDYEYGWETLPMTNLVMRNQDEKGYYGLAVQDLNSGHDSRWWVNVGMRKTGGWLQEDYGRRYFFHPRNYVAGSNKYDTIRFCLIRNVTNEHNRAGYQRGWPLSKKNEQALVLEICPLKVRVGNTDNNAILILSEYMHNGDGVVTNELHRWENGPARDPIGLQLSDDMVSVFHVPNDKTGRYAFLDSDTSTPDELDPVHLVNFHTYFAKAQTIGGVVYPGTNFVNGKLYAPEMRAVFEFVGTSDSRSSIGKMLDTDTKAVDDRIDYLDGFKVTPAWQFDVYLEHPESVTNRATIAQKIGRGEGRNIVDSVLTYDTHGTEHKGFRYDERHPNGK